MINLLFAALYERWLLLFAFSSRTGWLLLAGATLALTTPFLAPGQSRPMTQLPHTAYRTVQVDGLSIFYREAGPKNAPTILLLHGLCINPVWRW